MACHGWCLVVAGCGTMVAVCSHFQEDGWQVDSGVWLASSGWWVLGMLTLTQTEMCLEHHMGLESHDILGPDGHGCFPSPGYYSSEQLPTKWAWLASTFLQQNSPQSLARHKHITIYF